MTQSPSLDILGLHLADLQQRLHIPTVSIGTAMLGVALLSATTLTAHASTLINATDYLQYELPQEIQERCDARQNCPDIEVQYLNSNHDWMNKITNARIDEIVVNSKPTESAPVSVDHKNSVKTALDEFAASQFNDLPDDSVFVYSLMVKPSYLGHVDDYELFEIDSYVFTGGAHGMPYSEYLIFDQNTKRQIQLEQILRYGVKARFKAVAYDAYTEWVKTVAEDPSSYEKSWPFTLSDDVTLTDKGINLRYQHYAISPYAYGMPVLSIPYDKLHGIIKPQFFPISK